MKPKQKSFLQNLDLVTTILPFGCIALLDGVNTYSPPFLRPKSHHLEELR